MGNILQELAEQNSRKEYLASKETSIEYFDQQKAAIDGIVDTAGYAEIKNYFLRELESALRYLQKARGEELIRLQGAIGEINKFLEYLSNITTPTPKTE